MPKYQVIYKCQMCGELTPLNGFLEIPEKEAPAQISKMIFNYHKFLGHPVLQQAELYGVHSCGDGNCGLALFAGLKRVE